MNHRLQYFIAWLLLMYAAAAVHAQSDSQTLRSKYAGILNINEFDFGLPLRNFDNYPYSLGFQSIGGYRFNRLLSLGAGFGLQSYGSNGTLLMPVVADARLNFPQKSWTFYLAGDAGYAFSLRKTEKGGVLLNPSVGGSFAIADGIFINTSIGYRIQENKATSYGQYYRLSADYLSIKLAIGFRWNYLNSKLLAKLSRFKRMKEK